MYLVPIKHRVFVARDPLADESRGTHGKAIILPGNRKTADDKRSVMSVKGTVIDVGELVDRNWLAPADHVVYRWYTGDEFKVNGHACVMLIDNEILAREKRDGEE